MRGGLNSYVDVAAALGLVAPAAADADVSDHLSLSREDPGQDGYPDPGKPFKHRPSRQQVDLVLERPNISTNPPLRFCDRTLDLLRSSVTASHANQCSSRSNSRARQPLPIGGVLVSCDRSCAQKRLRPLSFSAVRLWSL